MIKYSVFDQNWSEIPVPLQLPLSKVIIRDVANECKVFVHSQIDFSTWDNFRPSVSSDQHASFMHLQYLHTAARLVWQNDVPLAFSLIHKNSKIKNILIVDTKHKKSALEIPTCFPLSLLNPN